MITKRQKQIVFKKKTKVHTEACYSALKLNLNSVNKERKYNKECVKYSIFLKISKRVGVLIMSGGLEKIKKLVSGGGDVY